ncbi:MAG: CDP-alcohol phosphatidyltransferase family protein [Parvibaculum sp.]
MLDAFARSLIDAPLNRMGAQVARTGVNANQLSVAGALFGVGAGVLVATGNFTGGMLLILISRLFDGFDGAVARATRPTDFGGYLDIICDYIFYAAIPLGFALASPENLFPAAVLLASFILSGTSFLAYAAFAEKRSLTTTSQGLKSFYYMAGLIEGTETIAAFVLFCLLPDRFPAMAYIFAALCVATMVGRLVRAKTEFAPKPPVETTRPTLH